jgi:putative chitinase
MVTPEQLHSIMPGLAAAKSTECFPFLAAAMTEFAIDAPARAAAFLAQLAHESGQLRFMEEIWGPTPAQSRYEPPGTLATQLGNTDAGDGLKFKGRGPIQITGRANYRRFGDLLGVDLVAAPARAAGPDLAFRIAGLFWSKKGLNELADQATADAFREITRRINGGFNGLPDRQQFYATARTVLGVSEAPATRGAEGSRAVPASAEPRFDRGYEAIRTAAPTFDRVGEPIRPTAPRLPRRKTKPARRARNAKPVARARKAKPAPRARKAKKVARARRAKPVARPRKNTANPRKKRSKR